MSDPTPDMLAMLRFDYGAIDMHKLLRRLAEQVVSVVIDAEADQLRGCGANSRNGYRERLLATYVKCRCGGRVASTVTAMYHTACDMLEGCCPRAAAILEEAEPEALAYLDFTPSHRKRLCTINVQERTS